MRAHFLEKSTRSRPVSGLFFAALADIAALKQTNTASVYKPYMQSINDKKISLILIPRFAFWAESLLQIYCMPGDVFANHVIFEVI